MLKEIDNPTFKWQPFSQKAEDSIIDSTARLNIWEGSVRSGKTISSIVRWLEFVQSGPEGLLLMTGKTNKTLERNILKPIQEMVGIKNAKINRGLNTFTLFNRKIDLMGAVDESSEGKIRGATIAGAYGDEVALWPKSYFNMLLSRMSVRGASFFGTTNPDSPYHWLKTEFLDRQDELNLKRFHFNIDDNPALDRSYVASLKKEYVGLWYQRFILGLWVLAEGAIYDMWDKDIHSIDTREALQITGRTQYRNYIVGVDYGTSNPCVFGLYGFDNVKSSVHKVKEYYYDGKVKRQKTDGQYASDMKEWLGDIRPQAIYVDPSAASFITELKQHYGNVIPAKNNVLDGIRFVGNMLTSDRFFVDKSCEETMKEFAGYVWDEKAQKRGEDAPVKEHDHCMDETRYALFTHFFRQYPQILAGFNLK